VDLADGRQDVSCNDYPNLLLSRRGRCGDGALASSPLPKFLRQRRVVFLSARPPRRPALTHRGSTELQVHESSYHRYARAELTLLGKRSKKLESRRRGVSTWEQQPMQDGKLAWSRRSHP
jgi:hypothetical protein